MSATPSSAGAACRRCCARIEPVRDRVGRVALVGEGWDNPPDWMEWDEIKANYYVDRDYLKQIGVEACRPFPIRRCTDTMSKGVFNPVVYRPLFERLGHGHLPDLRDAGGRNHPAVPARPRLCHGDFRRARRWSWSWRTSDAHEKILDVLARPEHYAEIVMGIRQDFGRRHTPEARLRELIAYHRGMSRWSRREQAGEPT